MRPTEPDRPEAAGRPRGLGRREPLPGWLWRLSLFCFVLATANAATAAYLPLFAVQELDFGARTGGLVLACFGAAGVFGRIWWARFAAGRDERPARTLTGLAVVAAVCVLPLIVATVPGLGGLVWLGALGVGAFATAAYAVAMLDVVRNAGAGTGRASGLVSVGFFLGFAAGPVGFGLLTAQAGYRAGWIAVAATLALSAAAGLPFRAPPPRAAIPR